MGDQFRALLIGVPEYKDEAIDNLRFIEDDLSELAEALRDAGYAVEVHDTDETDRDGIDSAVEGFFQDALAGQTLLLYISGHGVHRDDVDYLVPRGALTRSHDFAGRCVSLDFGRYVERSQAGDVIVFVDACREGFTLREMGGTNAASWSQMRVRRTGERHFGYVYACSPGERSRYTTAGASTFSLFSRALSTLVADPEGPRTLADIKEVLQSGVDALTAEHGCPRQLVRVKTETETDDFVVFVRPELGAREFANEHPWATLAREHPAWHLVAGGPGAEALREATIALVDRVARAAEKDERALHEDPWRSTGLTERMADLVRWLLSAVLNPEKLGLSPAEAALLVAYPFLHGAFWSRRAALACEMGPDDLTAMREPSEERAGYEQFIAGHSRLIRRAGRATATGRPAGTKGIGWWLFHRWLVRQPRHYQPDVVAELIAPPVPMGAPAGRGPGPRTAEGRLVADVLAPELVLTLLRALRSTPDPNPDPAHRERQVVGSTDVEQRIRVRLLVDLLTVAHRFALDPTTLSEVVVDHLGISYEVRLPELHATLETARWDPRGRTRVLHATCHHPAVDLALREHAAALDALLGAIDLRAGDDPQLAPLRDLPVHATADQVSAALTAAGKRVYESTELRFRLADDRIQELLMGEALYGDPALAVRELYQNALDACRYRQARTEYLRTQGTFVQWQGKIEFRQGVDQDGREYLECSDNGVGMSERELREVFSHAGMSFADLPEYIEEQAAWKAKGIAMHPNSRFGIGVLSYFMLADDITVTTCRLSREGHAGQRLQVDIAGPGALFHIQDLGRGHDAGTTVRLHLRPSETASSCVDLLRRILWISDYAVTATDATAELSWDPGRLSDVAPLGALDPHEVTASREEEARVAATSTPAVWWCGTRGGVLADGLWVGIGLFGAVVNLTGPHAPRLTVDRRRALDHDEEYVDRLLHEEVPALLAEKAEVLDHPWLSDMTGDNARLADAIFTRAAAAGHRPWSVAAYETDFAVVGCFPQDVDLFQGDGGSPIPPNDPPALPAHIVDWRLHAWVAAGHFPGVSIAESVRIPQARPTDDYLILARNREIRPKTASIRTRGDDPARDDGSSWLIAGEILPLGHVLDATTRTGRSLAEVADRLAELGYVFLDVPLPDSFGEDDTLLLSRDLDRQSPWLVTGAPVLVDHVLRAAAALERLPAEIAERLAELGYDVPDVRWPPSADPDDSRVLSEKLDGQPPWFSGGAAIPAGHVLRAAVVVSWTPRRVAARLTELGYRLLDGPPPHTDAGADADDLLFLSEDLDRKAPWLDTEVPVPVAHLMAAAAETRRGPAEIGERLRELGYRLPQVPLPTLVGPDDVLILRRDPHPRSPWLADGESVSLGHLARAAAETRRTPAEIAERLADLGYRLPAAMGSYVEHPDDRLMLSTHLSRQAPWLAANQPVPLGHVLRAADFTRRGAAEIAERLAELGHPLLDLPLPDRVDPDDPLILSAGLDGQSPWLRADQPVSVGHILRAAALTGWGPTQIAERLAMLGHRPPDFPLPRATDRDDALLLSRDLNRQSPWLVAEEPLMLGHVLRAATVTGRSPVDLVERLARLGHRLPDGPVPRSAERYDTLILSEGMGRNPPWRASDSPIPLSRILRAAAASGTSPVEIAARLAELGYQLPSTVSFGAEPGQGDA